MSPRELGKRANPNTIIRLVAGSIPAETRTSDVLSEDFGIREMLEVIMGQDGKRKLRLRHKTNEE